MSYRLAAVLSITVLAAGRARPPLGDAGTPTKINAASLVAEDPNANARAHAQTLLDESRGAGARGDVPAARAAIAAAVDELLALSDIEHDAAYLPLLDQLAREADLLGDPTTARRALERAIRVREAMGPSDDLDLARARIRLAYALHQLGELAAACSSFSKGVAVLESRFGIEAREVQTAISNQAITLRALGNETEARIGLEKVLAVRERTLPPDHIDLQRARFNLIVALNSPGDLERKRDLLARTSEVVDRTLPPEDRLVLAVHLANAVAAHVAGDLVGARAEYERLLAIYERTLPATDPQRMSAAFDLCTVFQALGKYDEAQKLGEQLLATVESSLPPDHPDALRVRALQGNTLAKLGDIRAARALLEPLLADLERTAPVDDPRTEDARAALADVLFRLRELPGAKELAELVLAARASRLPPDALPVSESRVLLGRILQEMGDLERARELFEAALAVQEATLPPETATLLLSRMSYANVLRAQGDLTRAGDILSSVVAAFEKTRDKDDVDLLSALGNLSIVEQERGRLSAARAIQERLLATFERTRAPDDQLLITTRGNLGWLLLRMGDAAAARALIERAIEGREKISAPDDFALQGERLNLANLLTLIGDLPAARALQEEVLSVYERTLEPDHPNLASARQNLSVILEELGDLGAARAMAEEVVVMRERTLSADHHDLQAARTNLAQLLARLGEHDAARALDEKVFAILATTLQRGDPELESARRGLAAELAFAGELSRARELQEEALLALRERVSADHPDLRAATIELAWTLVRLGDLGAARTKAHELALNVSTAIRAALLVSPREASERWNALHHDVSAAASLALVLHPDPELDDLVFRLFEEIRSASQQALASIDDRGDPALRALLDRDAEIRARIHDATAGEGTRSQPIADLVRERDATEGELRRLSIAHGLRTSEIRPADVAHALPEDACAVAYSRYDRLRIEEQALVTVPCLLAHVVDPTGRVERIELGPIAPIEAAVDAWRDGVGHPLGSRGIGAASLASSSLEREEAAARTLRALVLEPVLRTHPTTRKLHVCLDDALQLVALDALLVGDAKPCEVRVEVSLARLIAPRARTASDPRLCVVGGVDYDAEVSAQAEHPTLALAPPIDVLGAQRGNRTSAGWPHLAETEAEARSIARRFTDVFSREPTLLLGAAASKAALAEAARDARFVHIATHGYFADESAEPTIEDTRAAHATPWMTREEAVRGLAPMTLCGLALAGANRGMDDLGRVPGVITAEEIAGLDLSHCELAVLSACETNVGITRAGLGIQSLQAALHAAGARTAITSLWKVDDDATRILFEDFYTRIWSGHETKSDALWHAKMALRASGHPTRDWAGWILTGDPD